MIEDSQYLFEIRTLGQFTVRCRTVVVSEKARRSVMLWELFKYLLTHRGSRLSADSVLETLWPDKEYEDAKSVFKAQVHRLKKMLAENELDDDRYITIVYTQGCYRLDTGNRCWLDTVVFEDLFNKANELATSSSREAMDAYEQLISLYRGDYLPEISSPWVLSARKNYLRIFLKSVYNLEALYRDARMFLEAIRIYEDALQVVPFEEELHIRYLQALMDAGRKREARAHYENITSRNYLEIGVKPSVEMKDIYQQIACKNERVELDLSNIQEMIAERSKAEGAFICQPDYFRFLCSLEKRRLERKNRPVLLGLLSITRLNYNLPPSDMLEGAVTRLKEIIAVNIRKGDVYTQWNEAQFLLLLPDLTLETGEKVLQRINSQFQKRFAPEDLVLRYKIQPLLHL
ncbi:MAG TPA: hypothetical protein GX693_02530 [Firmicutes bacterium]|nr:hypothetical protein [Bacillota bacterium]